jgi:hypothetical protein
MDIDIGHANHKIVRCIMKNDAVDDVRFEVFGSAAASGDGQPFLLLNPPKRA